MINTHDLKLVKNAKITLNNDVHFVIEHYGTVILSHNQQTNITEVNYNCSKTSNRQIECALQLLHKNLTDCIDIHNGLKYNFSGDQC